MPLTPAKRLLQELGITEPDVIERELHVNGAGSESDLALVNEFVSVSQSYAGSAMLRISW